ncbi:MAG TPA: hypothetical protein IAC18_04155 [Candidatus Scatomorpha merdipullorum]|uniref:Uncharacterized protein n=1 Tax=Candidatus Scatomorpha merdipullorum TaxID=2840927 RepID=A0A9D1FDF2_9FIRM|nr:hypothetical protein [Candidatus Scatomorpha merdipullorum]
MRKNIPPRAAALVCWIMSLFAFLLGFIGLINHEMTTFYIALVLIIVFMILLPKIFWRCPHCGASLPASGMMRIRFCPYCNKPL